MKSTEASLDDIQRLVMNIVKVERNHSIPGTKRHENVVEHSFSVTMLCWRIFELVKPPLNMERILKYSLVHDFSERGQKADINTYATKQERNQKKEREKLELIRISNEYRDFKDLVSIVNSYEDRNAEALFVWSVDKMQAIILGGIDNWRPYEGYGVCYEEFCEKGDEFIENCSPYLRNIFKLVLEAAKQTYYDNPRNKSRRRRK